MTNPQSPQQINPTTPANQETPPKRRGWTRRAFLWGSGILGASAMTGTAFGLKISSPGYAGPASDHFDGKRFYNPKEGARGFLDVLKWMSERKPGPWSEFRQIQPAAPPPQRVGKGELRLTFVNHTTVLIQMDGVNILTDPVWSERVSPVAWAGPKRHAGVGLRMQDLPPIDLILLSHNHYDHCDVATLSTLCRVHRPQILTPLGNTALLNAYGIGGSQDLDWWDAVTTRTGLRVTCTPAWHFSNRGLFDRDTSLWGGFMIGSEAGDLYFAGDTGFGDFFEEIARRFPTIRMSLLPIGAYRPRWFMSPVHMGPDEAVLAHRVLKTKWSMGVHFGTFAQADDGEKEPVELLNATLDKFSIPRERFRALENGEVWVV
ncbi:MAG: MBL fold metallo-hydrolase [Chlorobi bacterium CHB2]|nr:MBL fold metallo-hydrolase [Chlorobi bacterium CHB2]